MKFNLFIFASLFLSLACIPLALLIFLNARSRVHWLWGAFNVAVGVYGLGMFFAGISKTYDSAFLGWKVALFGVANIGLFFYFVVSEFCGTKQKRIWNSTVIIHGILFSFFTLATNFIFDSLQFVFNDFYYYKAGIGWNIFFAIWIVFVVRAFILLYQFIRENKGFKAVQAKYLFFGMLLGFTSGATASIPSWGIHIYPAWHFLVSVYAAICTYAIFRYQLMDVRVAVTRLSVFIFVYSLVLGVPFGSAIWGKQWLMARMGENWFWVPMVTLLVLATVGPFIFIFFQRRTEAQILKEEKRIYSLIKKASAGMVGIRDIQKLFNVLIDVLRNNLRLDHAFVYLFDPNEDSYILKASKPEDKERMTLTSGSPLFDRLRKTKYPVYYEEMLHLQDNSKGENGHIKEIVTQMQQLSATVVIPAIKEDVLLAFIVLGKREGKDVFSPELLDLLYVVGNEIALAIEISLSLIERDKLLNDNFEKSYYAGLGYLCTSVSHQMNNRFGGVINLLYDPWETLEETNYKELPHEELVKLVDTIKDRIKSTLDIAENGGQVTKDILDLSKSKMEPGIVEFDNALNKSISFVLIKRINSKLEVVREYPKDVLLWIGQAPLQDILANALDNTWFAMNLKKNHFNDPNYKPMVIVRGHVHKAMFHFEIEDNGMGIKKEYLNRVLDPMFTTKSHQDGTGMGTWVMKQFIEKHGGTITYESEWEHWTKAKISLPLATKEQKEEKKNV